MKKLSTNQFIERAIKIHGNTYNYSKTHYVSTHKPITIVCKKHGEFKQLPINHLRGSGCLVCSQINKQMTTNQFIERAIKIHGKKYIYASTRVCKMNNKITIDCPAHGAFLQWPMDHLRGTGCPACGGVAKLTYEDFVQRSNVKHNTKYDYSCVNLQNTHTKVEIICQEHGSFFQTPSDHLHGYGCPSCAGTKPVTKDIFISRALIVHGDVYDYTKLVVEGMNKKGTIICPIHGEFKQRLADHLDGVGCPECSLAKRGQYSLKYFQNFPNEKKVPAILYLVILNDTFCKVGITKNDVTQRFGNKQVRTVHQVKSTLFEAYKHEQQILEELKYFRFRAKELHSKGFTGWTECFPVNMVDTIKQYIIAEVS